MHELEDDLRRYGEAIEHDLLDGSNPTLTDVFPRPRRGTLAVAAAAVVLVGGAVSIVATMGDGGDSVVATDPATSTDDHAGVFATPTNTILVFSDGTDGATAVDLDQHLAGRRAVDGERAGDQQYRLTLTGDHLVVGWGEIYAAPLDGGPSHRIADATIYLPASEEGTVWTLTWEGGRIGAGSSTLRRVQIDGTTVVESDSFDPATLEPVQAVPGGLLVNSPDGVAVWNADTESTGPVLGHGRAVAAATDGQVVAWCASSCAEVHTAPLTVTGAPTARHVAPGAQQIALSRDGAHLAVLRPNGDSAELVVTTPPGSEETVVGQGLDASGALAWSPDGRQLFYTESSYGAASMRVGRYHLDDQRWEIETLPVGGGFTAIAVTPDEARSFFVDDRQSRDECPAGVAQPSGRHGVCTFALLTRDSPDAR